MGIEPIKPQKPLADIKAIQAGLRAALLHTALQHHLDG